jgi:alcohol dehydrogenase
MRTAVLGEYGEPLDLTTVPAPDPSPDGAVVSVEACGLCRSDWHAWQGHGEWNDDRVPRGQVLGLSAVQLGTALGARVVAVDPKAGARDRAGTLGAVETIDPDAVDPVDEIRSITDGGAAVSVDALGIAQTCRNSVRCLRERGTHAQVGLTTEAERGDVALPTDWITRWELTVVGSRGMPPTHYGALFDLLDARDVDPGTLIARECALGEVSDRLAAMSDFRTDGVELLTTFV